MISGYLWNFHATGQLGVGAGISAMPSLHIATVSWIYLAFRGQQSQLDAARGVVRALHLGDVGGARLALCDRRDRRARWAPSPATPPPAAI